MSWAAIKDWEELQTATNLRLAAASGQTLRDARRGSFCAVARQGCRFALPCSVFRSSDRLRPHAIQIYEATEPLGPDVRGGRGKVGSSRDMPSELLLAFAIRTAPRAWS